MVIDEENAVRYAVEDVDGKLDVFAPTAGKSGRVLLYNRADGTTLGFTSGAAADLARVFARISGLRAKADDVRGLFDPGWIVAADRAPKTGVRVLGRNAEGCYLTLVHRGVDDVWRDAYEEEIPAVTHWAPPPPPPGDEPEFQPKATLYRASESDEAVEAEATWPWVACDDRLPDVGRPVRLAGWAGWAWCDADGNWTDGGAILHAVRYWLDVPPAPGDAGAAPRRTPSPRDPPRPRDRGG